MPPSPPTSIRRRLPHSEPGLCGSGPRRVRLNSTAPLLYLQCMAAGVSMKKLAWLVALLASAAVVFVLIPTGAGQTVEEELWRHRNIGKALFETPTSIAEAPAELKKALELAPDSFRDRLNYG